MTGYVHPGQPDIFISYAQVNDQPVPGWVSSFTDWLERLLAMELGPAAAAQLWVFRDFQLPTGANLAVDIRRKVEDSAALLLVLSPAYRESVWTARELAWFLDHISTRHREAAGARIYPVEFTRVDRPPEIAERLCAQFWYEDPVRKRPRTLGFPKPLDTAEADREFFNRLRDLCEDIAVDLKRQKAVAAAPKAVGPVVYLAHTTADLQLQREQVRRYLEQEGFRVVPDRAYIDDATFRADVAADLAPAVLFVQLLSEDPGPALAGSADRRVWVQAGLAGAIGKPALQWRRAGPLSADVPVAHRALLDLASTADLEAFTQGVVERVRKLLAPERAKAAAPAGFDCTVFVNLAENARPRAAQISQGLADRRAYPILSPAAGSVGQNRLAFEANLEDCDGLLLVAAEAGPWVQSQLLQTGKALARRERPLPVFQWTGDGAPAGPDFDAFLNGLRGGGRRG